MIIVWFCIWISIALSTSFRRLSSDVIYSPPGIPWHKLVPFRFTDVKKCLPGTFQFRTYTMRHCGNRGVKKKSNALQPLCKYSCACSTGNIAEITDQLIRCKPAEKQEIQQGPPTKVQTTSHCPFDTFTTDKSAKWHCNSRGIQTYPSSSLAPGEKHCNYHCACDEDTEMMWNKQTPRFVACVETVVS